MTSMSRDPVVNAIYGGMNRGIRVAMENQCHSSAVVLILSGIDTMAYLGMPAEQQDVTKEDFVAWVERYIHFPCREQLSGLDLYGATCGMLHSFSSVSRLARERKCRQVGYVDRLVPEVAFNPSVSEELVMVSVEALAEALFRGIDRFLIDLYGDADRSKIADLRFQYVVQMSEYEGGSP
jgi:hypothetical protein